MGTPDLAIIIACYGQPQMMAKQEKHWLSFPENLAERLEIIIVDDHGDPPYSPSAEVIQAPFEFRAYRADENIEWNQMGARNLGMREAEAPWRLMLDPDMLLSAPNLARIFQLYPEFRKGIHYKPQLRPCRDPWGSPNLYIVHGDDFWRAGGYNEDFAGHKGYSDVVLHRTLDAVTIRSHLDRIWLEFVSNTQIPDADVRTLSRDLAVNREKFEAAVKWASKNGWKNYAKGVVNHVRFPWHRIR